MNTKNKLKHFFTLAAAACVLPYSAFAQAGPDDDAMIEKIKQQELNGFGSVGLLISNPQGAYRRGLDSIGVTGSAIGFNLTGGYYFDPVPFAISADLGFLFHKSQSTRKTLRVGQFTDTLDYETQLMSIPFNISGRVQPNIATWVFPYFEVVGGFELTSGNYQITQYHGEQIGTESHTKSDIAWQYGVGVGSMFKFADYVSLPATLQRFYVDVRMRYLWSSTTTVTIYDLDPNTGNAITKSSTIGAPEAIHFSLGIGIQL